MLDLNENDTKCDCGLVHKISTEILFNKGSINRISLLLKKYYAVSRIAIVYDRAVSNEAQKVLEILVKNNFEISEICYEKLTYPTKADCERLLNLPEDVRFFIGVGSGSICSVVRHSASLRKNDFGIVATSPSTDSYLDNFTLFEDKYERAVSPKFLFLDEDIFSSSPEYLVASGIGSVFNCYLSLFNLIYKNAIYKQKYCKTVANNLLKTLNKFVTEYKKSNTPQVLLMNTLLEISKARVFLGELDSSADSVAYILSVSSISRFYGENLFLSAFTIINMYKSYLSGYSIDTLLPVDYVKGIKLLNLRLGNDFNYPKDRFVSYKQANLTSIGFLIKEYKEDFLTFLNNIDVDEFAKTFRRAYADAGFWLKGYIKASDLLAVTSLSGLISKNTLCSFMKETGFMEEML